MYNIRENKRKVFKKKTNFTLEVKQNGRIEKQTSAGNG